MAAGALHQKALRLGIAFDNGGDITRHPAIGVKVVKVVKAAGHDPAPAKTLVHAELADITDFFNLAIDKKGPRGSGGYGRHFTAGPAPGDQYLAKAAHRAAAQKIIRLALIGYGDLAGNRVVGQKPADGRVIGGGG